MRKELKNLQDRFRTDLATQLPGNDTAEVVGVLQDAERQIEEYEKAMMYALQLLEDLGGMGDKYDTLHNQLDKITGYSYANEEQESLRNWDFNKNRETEGMKKYLDDRQVEAMENECGSMVTVDSLVGKIRERYQLSIYTVNDNWVVQLYDADVCANDQVDGIYEVASKELIDALFACYMTEIKGRDE